MQTTTTKEAIRKELIAKPKTNRAELAIKYGVTLRNVGAVYASINRFKNKTVTKKGNNTYTNHNGVHKEVARILMANHVIDSGVIGNILTLPNTDWVIEQKIAKQVKGVSFSAVEYNKETFLKYYTFLSMNNITKTCWVTTATNRSISTIKPSLDTSDCCIRCVKSCL